MVQKGTAFCYPAELAHGFFSDLLRKKPDLLFLPTSGACM
jgi:predicted nucleotide-binding protein (sugar kinase/HSP70/actin superfamily)